MSTQTEVITNALDAVAFALAGSEIVGIAELTATLDTLFKVSTRIVDDILSMDLLKSWLTWIVIMFLLISMPLSFFGLYAGYVREVDVGIRLSVGFLIYGTVFVFVISLGFYVLGVFYRYLLEKGYETNRALLIMGGAVFMISRAIALQEAIKEQIPTVGELMHEPPSVRLGPLQLPGPVQW